MTLRLRPLRVVLTGGIATGKSHCLQRFIALGAPTIDADALAHRVLQPGAPGADDVLARFGTLDRKTLGGIVFADAEARRALEDIVHPRVFAAINDWFRGLKAAATFGIADIPLVFETGHEGSFDRVIVTTCRADQQRERLLARGLSAADADARLAAQLTSEERTARARAQGLGLDVIDTSGSVEATDRQVDRIFDRLSAMTPRTCS